MPGVPDHGQDRSPSNPERPLQGFSTENNLHALEKLDQRPRWGVRQDKDRFSSDRKALRQPAAVNKITRSQSTSRKSARSQNKPDHKPRTVPVQFWVSPLVKAELSRVAEQEGLSVSATGAAFLQRALQQNADMKYSALLQPIIKQIIRDEFRAFGNRIVFFLMRIAFASEQARILISNVLSRVLKRDGAPDNVFTNLLDQSNKMARRNIIAKTPQMESLLEEWEGFGEWTEGYDKKSN